jgi:Uri superfamily endonuclease
MIRFSRATQTEIPAAPGTYALLLRAAAGGRVRVGRLGELRLRRGWYVYVGSARGAGGLGARLGHHFQVAARPHWHIDYLRAHTRAAGAWFVVEARAEHAWAATVAAAPGAEVALPGFGSSDCACATHLYWFPRKPHAPGGGK